MFVQGMDITFGGRDFAAGMLVRAVSSLDGTLIEGPCKVVDLLLANCECQSITAFVDKCGSALPSLCRLQAVGNQLVFLAPWRAAGDTASLQTAQ